MYLWRLCIPFSRFWDNFGDFLGNGDFWENGDLHSASSSRVVTWLGTLVASVIPKKDKNRLESTQNIIEMSKITFGFKLVLGYFGLLGSFWVPMVVP